MLLRQMKYFAAIVDFNSFTEAAEQCYISQSAISQQIQSLEKELGVKLIQRETIRIGRDDQSSLRIRFLRCYGGQELHQTVAQQLPTSMAR